jgi:hypothetical protein
MGRRLSASLCVKKEIQKAKFGLIVSFCDIPASATKPLMEENVKLLS